MDNSFKINVSEPIVYMAVKKDDFEKVGEILTSNDIETNVYDCASSVVFDSESRWFVNDLLEDENSDFFIGRKLSNEDKDKIYDECFGKYYETLEEEYGIYDNDKLYGIKEDVFENIKEHGGLL